MNFIFLFGVLIRGGLCDWVSEWLAPLEYQYKDISAQNSRNRTSKFFPGDDNSEVINFNPQSPNVLLHTKNNIFKPSSAEVDSKSLKIKLEVTLKAAEVLTTTLKKQIKQVESQERLLKEAIANGRSGVTTLTVLTVGHAPRTYIIRDGFWTLCNGMVQYPAGQTSYNIFKELFSTPRCIGQELTSKRDPCVFHSMIKYQTIPETRRSTYYDEEDYLCLRASFNNTLENFMSVTKKVVDETCKNGVIRSLTDNALDCGVRVLSEYTYYPEKDDTSILPLEYCKEKDGSCKLIVAWHLTNKTIESFEFLNSDQNFKKFFINSNSYLEPFI